MKLRNLIKDRIKLAFHPYPICLFKKFPSLAKEFNVLHAASVGLFHVWFDGVEVADVRGMEEKYNEVLKAFEAVFGRPMKRLMAAIGVEAYMLPSGLCELRVFEEKMWHAAVCARKTDKDAFFAFISDTSNPSYPWKASWLTRSKYEFMIRCAAVLPGNSIGAEFWASEKFFLNPKEENAMALGDILFLTQMRKRWEVYWEVDPVVEPLINKNHYRNIARVAAACPGLDSLVRYVRLQVLFGGEHADVWRRLHAAIEEEAACC